MKLTEHGVPIPLSRSARPTVAALNGAYSIGHFAKRHLRLSDVQASRKALVSELPAPWVQTSFWASFPRILIKSQPFFYNFNGWGVGPVSWRPFGVHPSAIRSKFPRCLTRANNDPQPPAAAGRGKSDNAFLGQPEDLGEDSFCRRIAERCHCARRHSRGLVAAQRRPNLFANCRKRRARGPGACSRCPLDQYRWLCRLPSHRLSRRFARSPSRGQVRRIELQQCDKLPRRGRGIEPGKQGFLRGLIGAGASDQRLHGSRGRAGPERSIGRCHEGHGQVR